MEGSSLSPTSKTKAPNSEVASVDHFGDFFSHYFERLHLENFRGLESNQAGTSSCNNVVGRRPPIESLQEIQQPGVAKDLQCRTGSQNILLDKRNYNILNGGDFLGSNLYAGLESSTGSCNYASMYDVNYQQNNFVATPMTDLLKDPERVPVVRRDYGFNMDLYQTLGRENNSVSCIPDAVGKDGCYYSNKNYPCDGRGISDSLRNQHIHKTARHYTDLNFDSLQGQDILMMAISESGSQHLQKIMVVGGPEYRHMIVEAVLECLPELVTNKYGQYVFQKLVGLCDEHQLRRIVVKFVSQNGLLVNVSLNRQGSHSIQKLIKVLAKTNLIKEISSALANEFYALMTDNSGRDVILECLKDSEQNEALFEVGIRNCIEVAVHKQGCIAMKDWISNISGSQRDCLLNIIADNSIYLAQDPSGNYVLQHVLDLQKPDITEKICFLLQGHYVRLSLQKVGSHVVEACLISPAKNYVIDELLLAGDRLLQVANNQFGNFVIQTALKITKGTDDKSHQSLIKILERHMTHLVSNPHGKNVFKLIEGRIAVYRNRFELIKSKS